jgi:4-amino-4-deoxy-L-arabinose transferase-like glycosyltransferase
VVIGLFTLASTKLPSYITPCYPAVALLVGRFLDRLSVDAARIARFWPYLSYAVMAAIGLAITIAIPAVASEYVPGIEPLSSMGGVLMLGAGVAAAFWYRRDSRLSVQSVVATSIAFVAMLFTWGAVEVGQRQQIQSLTAEIRSRSEDPKVAALQTIRSTWVFYCGTTVRQLAGHDGQDAVAFVTRSRDHFLIAPESEYDAIRKRMPLGVGILESVPFFLEDESLLLIGHTRANRVARRDSAGWRNVNR